MKKTLKLLLIFMGSIVVLLVGGIGGYSLIMNNQTFYIYDLRFVQPSDGERGYIYTKDGENYKTMPTSKVYLQSEDENYLPVAVFVSTSNGNTSIGISSSDESVAKIEYRDNKCFVKYLKAGEATITTTMGPVSDSFNIEVFEGVPSDFRVYDFSYYGENYATRASYVNNIVCYSDENEALAYEYSYELFDDAGNIDEEFFNSGLLEIDASSFESGYFDSIELDRTNKKLNLVCKQQQLDASVHTSIAVKSYIMVDGKKCLNDIFEIDVYIIANEVEFAQIEVSTNPDFSNNCVYLNIDNVKYSDNLSSNELLSYLTCQRVEENLNLDGENAVFDLFITENVPEIYLKFRLVYTNGTILELNKKNMNELYTVSIDGLTMTGSEAILYLTPDQQNYLECEPMGEYFILKMTTDYLNLQAEKTSVLEFSFLGDLVDLELNANEALRKFNISYLDLTNIDDVKKMYQKNSDGTYKFAYWDKRTQPANVVYDENGNVVEFIV